MTWEKNVSRIGAYGTKRANAVRDILKIATNVSERVTRMRKENDMGIYIPNMSKPKSCYNHCDFIAMEEVGCPLKDYAESHQYKDKIHPNCPLIEIIADGFTRATLQGFSKIEVDANCGGAGLAEGWVEATISGERRTYGV